jgi:small subunit ribosomal protein S16
MSVVLRLSRQGAKDRPFYWVVASDSAKPQGGGFLQKVGSYEPKKADPKEKLKLDREIFDAWIAKGARPTQTVRELIKNAKA